VDDADGDGLREIVTAPRYQVQVFNGQTGALKAAVPELQTAMSVARRCWPSITSMGDWIVRFERPFSM
jgi:hypothetical protein